MLSRQFVKEKGGMSGDFGGVWGGPKNQQRNEETGPDPGIWASQIRKAALRSSEVK